MNMYQRSFTLLSACMALVTVGCGTGEDGVEGASQVSEQLVLPVEIESGQIVFSTGDEAKVVGLMNDGEVFVRLEGRNLSLHETLAPRFAQEGARLQLMRRTGEPVGAVLEVISVREGSMSSEAGADLDEELYSCSPSACYSWSACYRSSRCHPDDYRRQKRRRYRYSTQWGCAWFWQGCGVYKCVSETQCY